MKITGKIPFIRFTPHPTSLANNGTKTTMALNEEGGKKPKPYPPVTSQALGEEGGKNPKPPLPPVTSQALGEEGGK